MRSAIREIKAILRIWWLIVPGGALGVLAIVQVVRGAHHGVWLWVALAMTALWLATCFRLRQVLGELRTAREREATPAQPEASPSGHGELDSLAATGESLATEMDRFAGERKRYEPSPSFGPVSSSEEWWKSREAGDRYTTETKTLFQERFVGRILEFVADAERRGFRVAPASDGPMAHDLDPGLVGFLTGPSPIEDRANAVRLLAGRIRRRNQQSLQPPSAESPVG